MQRGNRKLIEDRKLPAAVLRDGEPGSDLVARVIPVGASEVKIGDCVLGYRYASRKGSRRRKVNLTALQARQVHDLHHDRFGQYGVLPFADEARPFAIAIAALAPAAKAAVWISRYCDALPEAEQKAILAAAGADPHHWSVDELGSLLDVTVDERDRLSLTNLGIAGMTRAQRKRMSKDRARDRKRAARAAARASEPPKVSASKEKPWEAFGWSRRTWYRRGKPDPALALTDTASGTRNGRSNYINSAADESCANGSAISANEKAPSLEEMKPWKAEGISRRTYFRRKAAIKTAATSKTWNAAKAGTIRKLPPQPISISFDGLRAVAARLATISRRLEETNRPLVRMVRAATINQGSAHAA